MGFKGSLPLIIQAVYYQATEDMAIRLTLDLLTQFMAHPNVLIIRSARESEEECRENGTAFYLTLVGLLPYLYTKMLTPPGEGAPLNEKVRIIVEGLESIYEREVEQRDSIHWDDGIVTILQQYANQDYETGDESFLSECADTILQCASPALIYELSYMLSALLELDLPMYTTSVTRVCYHLMEEGNLEPDVFINVAKYSCTHLAHTPMGEEGESQLNNILTHIFMEAPFEANPASPHVVMKSMQTHNMSRHSTLPLRDINQWERQFQRGAVVLSDLEATLSAGHSPEVEGEKPERTLILRASASQIGLLPEEEDCISPRGTTRWMPNVDDPLPGSPRSP